MNHSVNRSVNHSHREACPVHWGNGREWKGMEGNGRDNYIIIVTYVSRGGRR